MHDWNKIQDDVNYAKPEGGIKNLPNLECCLFLQAKHTGSWLIVQGATVTGTLITSAEICDFLCAHYDVNLPKLKKIQWLISVLIRLPQNKLQEQGDRNLTP